VTGSTERPKRVTDDDRIPPELVVVTIGAVLVGIVLRFVARTPLWLDEALSVNVAALPIADIPEALRHDGHPPLYYFLLHGWMEWVGTSDIAVRALSGLLSVATLPLAWLAARRRGGRTLALITVAVLALAPFALRYATETRMYALVMLLVFAGYLLVDDVVRRGRGGYLRLVGITIVTALLLYSHYWAIWLLGAVVMVVGWRALRSSDRSEKRGARTVLIAIAVGGLLFVPWVPSLLYQSTHTGTPWATAQRPASILAVTLADFGGGDFRDAEFMGTVLALLFVLGLFGRAIARDRIQLELRTEGQFRYESLVVLLTMVLGSIVAYASSSAYASRYTAVLFPMFILVIAGGVSRFLDRWVRLGVLGVVLALSLVGAYYGATASRTQADQIAAAVSTSARPGDLVIYCPDQLGPAGERAMRSDLDQVVFPDFTSPTRVDWVDYAERNQNASAQDFAMAAASRAGPEQGVFLVWSGDYRGVEDQCERVLEALTATRGGGQVLVAEDGDEHFEHAQLVWFPAET